MKKKSKGIAFFISVFFISLNMLGFFFVFYLISNQYSKMAEKNIEESNHITAKSMEQTIDNVKFYMNELTLKIYSDLKLNSLCNQLYTQDYADNTEKEILIAQAEQLCNRYLYDYTFVQSVGICIEDESSTNISAKRGSSNFALSEYRKEIQEKVIENEGVIQCFDVGKEHQVVFARTIRNYENVLKDNRIIGTVMIGVSERYLTDILKNTLVTPNSFALLVNEKGEITHTTNEEWKNKTLEEILEEKNNKIFLTSIENLKHDLVMATPYDDIRLSIGAFTKTLSVSMALMILLNLGVTLLLSHVLTRPMEKLIGQIQNIGIDSTTGQYIEAKGYLEIENIADSFNRMMERLQNLAKENYEISISEKNARIEALQSQINPHFIFNTLDTINWKVMFLDVPEVSNMISCLGDMLRYTTYKYGKYITVAEEVTQIRNYLYIQKIRYDNSFQEYINMEKETENIVIPCLIIQPLIENAVVHGLNGKKNGVLVLRIRIRKKYLEIMVFDNGQGMSEDTIKELLAEKEGKSRESIGVANVKQRLQLTYSIKEALIIKSKIGYYTKIEMKIPIEKEIKRGI